MGEEQQRNQVERIAPLSLDQKVRLIEIARETIRTYVLEKRMPEFKETEPRLLEQEGAFVTIRKRQQLRGCIGSILSRQPLFETVRDMAAAAAADDPRFPPVSPEELNDLDIEISVLSQPRRIFDPNEVIPGKHGVIVSRGAFQRGVFLPQVATEQGWGREEFLSNLCAHKAGLPPDAWKDPATRLDVFTADVFSEEDVKR